MLRGERGEDDGAAGVLGFGSQHAHTSHPDLIRLLVSPTYYQNDTPYY